MSVKGKEKAIEPPAAELSDEDIDFFISKAPIKRSALPARSKTRDPSPQYISDTDDSGDSEGGDHGGKRKRKKRKKKESARPNLPEWTRQKTVSASLNGGSQGKDNRGRSGSSQAKDAVVISSDEDDGADTSGDPAAAERKRLAAEEARRARWRMELTPPPDLSVEREKELSRIIAEHIVIEVSDGDDADGSVGPGPASPSQEANVPASDQAVHLNISMKVDPARKEAGMSDIAIRAWEKQRRIIIGRRDPILRAIKSLAEKLSRRPEDIVLVYRDEPIHATGLAPMALGMGDEVELVGYEKAVWDKMEEARKARLLSAMTGDEAEATGEGNTAEGDKTEEQEASANVAGEPSPPKTAGRIALKLRGTWGEHSFGVKAHHTVGQVIAYYCTKVGRPGQEAKVRFMWDGDAQDPEVTMEDLEVESGDSVDMMISQ